jgi:hypothetical protein
MTALLAVAALSANLGSLFESKVIGITTASVSIALLVTAYLVTRPPS